MFTIRNTVIVALMQVGIIVAGVLAAGLCHRLWTVNGMPMPLPAAILYNYGVLWFAIPLGWSVIALVLRDRPGISDDVKSLVFLIGVLLVLLLGLFVIYADITPWLRFGMVMAGD